MAALNLIDGLTQYIDSYLSNQSVTKTEFVPALPAGQIDIPSVASVTETVILNYSIEKVWNAIKDCTFEFLSSVKSCELLPDKTSPSSVGTSRKLIYNDGTQQVIELREVSYLQHKLSYSVISSTPRYLFYASHVNPFIVYLHIVYSVSYSSATHTISLLKVTCADNGKQTFVQWDTSYSNDAKLQVIQDSRFKKKEAFKDLDFALSSVKNL